MADTVINQTMDLVSRYSTKTNSTDRDIYTNPADKEKAEALYKDKTTLDFTDMLGLMVAQFQNQTIDNQADTNDMMNQLVQMSSMQAMTELVTQVKELTLANVMSYSASLVGQTVTLGLYDEEGNLHEKVGVVEGAGTYDGQQVIFVEGKSYALSSIMAVGTLPARVEETKPDEGGDGSDKVEQTPGAETEDTENKEETEKVPEVDNDSDSDNAAG